MYSYQPLYWEYADIEKEHQQGVACLWKGFVSNISPHTFDVFLKKSVSKVSLGSKHVAFLADRHELYCYGSGEYGQIGNGKFDDVTEKPILVRDLASENVIDVACGSNHTGVVCSDGIVFCWGDNSASQCATEKGEKIARPHQVEICNPEGDDPFITQIACGDNHTMVLSNYGEIWSWGTGHQLGLGTANNPVSTPQRVEAMKGKKVLSISCGSVHSLAVVQKPKTGRSPVKPDDMSYCPKCNQELYNVSDQSDTVVICDHNCPDEISVRSSLGMSMDSLDASSVSTSAFSISTVKASPLKKSDVSKKIIQEDDAKSEGSQGTYTLEDTAKELENLEETDATDGGTVQDLEESSYANYPGEPTKNFPTNKAAKDYLRKQLAVGTTKDARKTPSKGPSEERIVSKLPQVLRTRFNTFLSSGTETATSFVAKFIHSGSSESLCDPANMDANHVPNQNGVAGQQRAWTDDIIIAADEVSLQTEVWSWGRGSHGQLGQGDLLDRVLPTVVKPLSAKNVIKVTSGSAHSLALTSSGQVYSWGSNNDGQLGHSGQLAPKRVKIPSNVPAWDIAAGTNHTLLLTDGVGFQSEIFYIGRQPSLQELQVYFRPPSAEKDTPKRKSVIPKGPSVKYAPRVKQPERLPFIRKLGWVRSISAAGDQCACIIDKNETGFVSLIHEFASTERLFHQQLSTLKSQVLKSLLSPEFFKPMEATVFGPPLKEIIDLVGTIAGIVGKNAIQLMSVVQLNQELFDLNILRNYRESIEAFDKYGSLFADLTAIGVFQHIGKNLGEFLTKQESTLNELCGDEEKQPNTAAAFHYLLLTPVRRIKEYSRLIGKIMQHFAQNTMEHSQLREVGSTWETLKNVINTRLGDAEKTKAFWEACPPKLADSLKKPSRRVMKDSKSQQLTLASASRFTSHWFILFDDSFVHAQSFSSHQVYPLATVWVEAIPDSDQAHVQTDGSEKRTPPQKKENAMQLSLPESSLLVSAPSSAIKKEWIWAINQAIDGAMTKLKRQKEKRDPSLPIIMPPVNQQRTGVVPPWPDLACINSRQSPSTRMPPTKGCGSGKPHGKGTMTWPDGSKYTGKFIQGLQQGHGMYTIPSGEASKADYMYDGQWLEGKMHGAGILRYQNGDIYEGYFKENQRHGHGMLRCGSLTSSSPSVYIGEWNSDKRCGYGVMDDINRGEKYMGMWHDDYRHGNGLVVTLDGVYYEGTFTHNKLSGVGLLITEDGTSYEGELATGPTLNGKGVLKLPNGDFIDGTFNGIWGDGVKVNGTFSKAPLEVPSTLTVGSGLYVVPADHKWAEIFNHCRTTLGCHGNIIPHQHKAWEAVAVALNAGKRMQINGDAGQLTGSRKGNLDGLERIPIYNAERISEEDYVAIQNYLEKAFDVPLHPLGQLVDSLVDVYRATYVGIGANRRLLTYAVGEVKSFVQRLYAIIRILFPGLPSENPLSPSPQSPTVENPYGVSSIYGYPTMELSSMEKSDKEKKLQITSAGLLHPVLLPRLYPPIFTLYALHNESQDDRYWDRILRLNKQPDIALMAYLGVNQKFWLFDETAAKDPCKKLSETQNECYAVAVETLQHISTTFSPSEKLGILKKTFECINQLVETALKEEHMWSMDDLFPMFQYVVIRARIRHLGSEIHLVDDFMEPHLANGELGLMFTTLKACYFQIQNEKVAF
ncbi:LOW QUALITY PROTEIN: alsin-like [Ptychodera flava]|uniref:LOW QUALITY PROTEIN: alsin-like n=1 Tax=Ptychodera flava TaxID=63121 RepID=UPI00396AAFB7